MKIYFGKRSEYFEGVYWNSLKENLIPTAEVDTLNDGWSWLNNKLKEIDFSSYYKKCIIDNHHEWIEVDFGSHIKFCLFYDLSNDDWVNFFSFDKKDEKKTKMQSLAQKLGNKLSMCKNKESY